MAKRSYRRHHDKQGKYPSSDGDVDTKAEKFIARKKFELSKDESDNDDHPSIHMMKAERYVTPPQRGYYQNFDKAGHGYAGHSHSYNLDKSTHGYTYHNHKLDEFPGSYPGCDDRELDIVTRGYAKHSHNFEKTACVRTVYDHNFDKMTDHGFAVYDHNSENSMHERQGYDYNSQYLSNYPHSGNESHHNFWNGGNDYYARAISHSSSQAERHVSRFFKRFEDMGFYNRGF